MSVNKRLSRLERRCDELERINKILMEQFEERLTAALDKVIGDGIEIEVEDTDEQLKGLLNEG